MFWKRAGPAFPPGWRVVWVLASIAALFSLRFLFPSDLGWWLYMPEPLIPIAALLIGLVWLRPVQSSDGGKQETSTDSRAHRIPTDAIDKGDGWYARQDLNLRPPD